MPFPRITVANSTIVPAGNALNANGPGTLIVDANAFLISESGGAEQFSRERGRPSSMA